MSHPVNLRSKWYSIAILHLVMSTRFATQQYYNYSQYCNTMPVVGACIWSLPQVGGEPVTRQPLQQVQASWHHSISTLHVPNSWKTYVTQNVSNKEPAKVNTCSSHGTYDVHDWMKVSH